MRTSTQKHLAWPITFLLFHLSRLIPYRNKRLWIFGAWGGTKYDDNAKYLFEYVNRNCSGEIHSVWITNEASTVEKIRKAGFEAYRIRSLKGYWYQIRCGVAIYTNSLIDFGVFPMIGGAEVVTTWHGMSFKKIYNSKYHGWELRVKQTMDRLFSWTYRTISTVPSEQGRKWLIESFTLDPKEIYITGQPRNDVMKQVDREKVLIQMGINPEKKVILYLPTYRLPSMGKDAMERIVSDMYDCQELNKVLDENNCVMVVKPHPLTPKIEIERRENFVVMDYLSVANNQELLGSGDMLVTDFSGGFIDFALLNRPIIFYEPDEEKFLAQSEEIDKKFFELCNLNKAVTPEDLADRIAHPSTVACDATNDIWEDKGIRGTCYSENVYQVIKNKISI